MIIQDASFNEVVKFISTLELANKEELLKLLIIDIEETKKDDAIKANPNDPVMNFRRQLNKENQKLFDDTLAKIIKIEQGYNVFKKQYNGMKARIKRVRERVAEIKEEIEKGEKAYFYGSYLEHGEISYIEKRYPQMDKAIESFKVCKKAYVKSFKSVIQIRSDNNAYFPQQFTNLESRFDSWFNWESKVKDDVRISENHYDKIQETLDSYKRNKEMNKQWAIAAAERAAAAAALIEKKNNC